MRPPTVRRGWLVASAPGFAIGATICAILSFLFMPFIGGVLDRAIAPAKQFVTARSKKREWIAVRRSEALDLDKAIFRARQLQSGCVRAALEVSSGRVPTAQELTDPDDCRDFRRDASAVEATWPDRYDLRSDAGWRWTLTRTSWPSRWPGPGFLLTLSPDPLLARDGPILELDGIDVLRLRESQRAPARIVYTPVPALQRLRECLQAAATTIPREDLRRLLYLPGSAEMRRACPNARVESTGSNTQGDEKLVVKFGEPPAAGAHLSLEYEVRYRVVGAGHFELRSTQRYRQFLLDADGAMHVTTEERDAELSDGPPLPCEVDPTAACP